ncbi:MAG TPA: GNAT family N-acetyltransferase, partial [Candidatus Krumholzibacteria bacterium]|nr:GNAT family N-acetyltransferase [Candidatus Krumholzibacteria bacterium]
RALILPSEGLPQIDRTTFWHCNTTNPIAAFGIYEEAQLVALATVTHHGHTIAEIGVDVAPDHKGRGLGRAVVSAAGNWIHERGLTIHATVAFWNVPSSRTMLSLGLRYAFASMHARPGAFRVPPQPLGSPLPEAEVFDAYPRWAMNRSIEPNPDNP